ncbi:hypothetical protein DSECCO2_226060 [anaerobic digester metagenome]
MIIHDQERAEQEDEEHRRQYLQRSLPLPMVHGVEAEGHQQPFLDGERFAVTDHQGEVAFLRGWGEHRHVVPSAHRRWFVRPSQVVEGAGGEALVGRRFRKGGIDHHVSISLRHLHPGRQSTFVGDAGGHERHPWPEAVIPVLHRNDQVQQKAVPLIDVERVVESLALG